MLALPYFYNEQGFYDVSCMTYQWTISNFTHDQSQFSSTLYHKGSVYKLDVPITQV